MTQLYTLTYFSRSVLDQANMAGEIEAILQSARRNNFKNDITGALLYSDGWFAHLIEGPQQAVEALFERIACDPRHRDIRLLHFKPLARRSFSRWLMAYTGSVDSTELPRHVERALTGTYRMNGTEVGQTLIAVLLELINKFERDRAPTP